MSRSVWNGGPASSLKRARTLKKEGQNLEHSDPCKEGREDALAEKAGVG